MAERNINDKVLEKVDSGRRGFLKRVLKTSFAVPVIATFSIAALSIDSAQAQSPYGNQSPLPDIDGAPYETEYLFQFPFNS